MIMIIIITIISAKVLRKIKAGYVINEGNLKVNHLLFMKSSTAQLQKATLLGTARMLRKTLET